MKNHLRENFDKNLYEKVPFKNVFFVLICQFQLIYSERTPIDRSAPCGPDRRKSSPIDRRKPPKKVEASDRRRDYKVHHVVQFLSMQKSLPINRGIPSKG